MVQYPMTKAQVAVVMRGAEGSGKGTFARALRRLVGSHSRQVNNPKGVVGNFNAHLDNLLLLFADEAFFAGDLAAQGVLKGLITEPTITIEPKGVNSYEAPSYLRVLMATNNEWAAPAGKDARRFFVLDVDDTAACDRAYFKALNAEMDNGGLAAFLYDLLLLDLTGWDYTNAPKTAGLMDQKLFSLRGVQRWWYGRLAAAEADELEIETGTDLLNDGGPVQPIPRAGFSVWRRVLCKADLYEEYTNWFRSQKAEYQPVVGAIFWKDIRKLAPGTTITRPRADEPQRPGMVRLPSLAEARAAFEKVMNGKIPWQTDFSDEDTA
jgi:hypothetical protein